MNEALIKTALNATKTSSSEAFIVEVFAREKAAFVGTKRRNFWSPARA